MNDVDRGNSSEELRLSNSITGFQGVKSYLRASFPMIVVNVKVSMYVRIVKKWYFYLKSVLIYKTGPS